MPTTKETLRDDAGIGVEREGEKRGSRDGQDLMGRAG